MKNILPQNLVVGSEDRGIVFDLNLPGELGSITDFEGLLRQWMLLF